MKYFLLCLVSGLSLAAQAQSLPSLTAVSLQPSTDGSPQEARMSADIAGRNYSCHGGVVAGQFSVLTCGDQRQAQVEFQSFAEGKHALVAFYESGRQSGALFIYDKSDEGFAPSMAPVVVTPGFGSLKQFQRYVIEPMAKGLKEDQIFETLPSLLAEVGSTMTLSQIRDHIANRAFDQWLPPTVPVPEPMPERPAPPPPPVATEAPVDPADPQAVPPASDAVEPEKPEVAAPRPVAPSQPESPPSNTPDVPKVIPSEPAASPQSAEVPTQPEAPSPKPEPQDIEPPVEEIPDEVVVAKPPKAPVKPAAPKTSPSKPAKKPAPEKPNRNQTLVEELGEDPLGDF